MNKKRCKRRCCDIWIPNKCLKCWNKCRHFDEHFFLSLFCRQNKSQAFSGYPISPISVATWQCVFSVKKDFSLALFAKGEEWWRQAGSYLQPLQMIYCEKSVLLHYARHRFVWWRDVHRVHTPRFVCLRCFLTAQHLILRRSIWFDPNA